MAEIADLQVGSEAGVVAVAGVAALGIQLQVGLMVAGHWLAWAAAGFRPLLVVIEFQP